MKTGIIKEKEEGETRVALIPSGIKELVKRGHTVLLESGAGLKSGFTDERYEEAGAEIVNSAERVIKESDIIVKVRPFTADEIDCLKKGSTVMGFMAPFDNRKEINLLNGKKTTVFSMEFIPRISRAQSMDALSSMSTVAGYKAVLTAAQRLGKFFPLLMTAAGTVPPANVLVIGAGVAGLQAIATSKRLGAKVHAFDTRTAVKEQIESLGARFVEMELPENMETEGGYAKEATREFIEKEMEAIGSRLPETDIVITTAQIFGKKAPLLITEDMVKTMPSGSIIVDLAAVQGGNCELSEPGETIEKHGVTIIGPENLPAELPVHASLLYSGNVVNLLKHIYGTESGEPDFSDEITDGSCICRDGEIINETLKEITPDGGEE